MKSLSALLPSILVVTLVLGFLASPGCAKLSKLNQPAQKTRAPRTDTDLSCNATGLERYSIDSEGIPFGIFEKFQIDFPAEDESVTVTFESGISMDARYIGEWMEHGSKESTVHKKHNVTVYLHSENFESQIAFKELIQAEILELDASPASDEPNCLVIRKLRFKAESVKDPNIKH